MYEIPIQVLSESVHKALQFYRENAPEQFEDTVATEDFVLLMDRFFDIFNVRHLNEGKTTRKTSRDPFREATDWRFDVCNLFQKYVCSLFICSIYVYLLL